MKRLLLLFGFSAGLAFAEPAAPPDPDEAAYPAIERFIEVLETVRRRHPEVDRLAYERLINHALEGLLGSLDPHSSFIHPEMAAMMSGDDAPDPEIRSLGLTLGLRDSGPYISALMPDGPAERAGVMVDSSVIAINAEPTEGKEFPALCAALRRPGGERTTLTLKLLNHPRPEDFEVTHRVVPERSVTVARMWDDSGTGYVRLDQFGRRCAREVEAALDELEDAGMKALLLDLRGNGGGDLHETVEILGLFLPPETVVVTTRGREGEEGAPMKTPARQRRQRNYPLAVLIDKGSASASELTAGALQDLQRAVIVGETSYGKGSVQNIVPMGGGTALRLTVATYHTPSGRTPHRIGITPDEPVAIADEDRRNFEDFLRRDHLPAARRAELEVWTDPVVRAALRRLKR
jgi:carboxyl-terminal processing protease